MNVVCDNHTTVSQTN